LKNLQFEIKEDADIENGDGNIDQEEQYRISGGFSIRNMGQEF
jgi:hypothetical protein